eukprot:gene1844-2177_t
MKQVPVVITETGVSDRRHALRARAITTYYQEVLRALADGADVRGIYYWTLMDNIEWHHGFHQYFGLYEWRPLSLGGIGRPTDGSMLELRQGSEALLAIHKTWPDQLADMAAFAQQQMSSPSKEGHSCGLNAVRHRQDQQLRKLLGDDYQRRHRERRLQLLPFGTAPLTRLQKLLIASAPASMRVKPVFQLDAGYLTPQQSQQLRGVLVPGAVNVLHQYIKVRLPASRPVKAVRESIDQYCGEADASVVFKGNGFNGTDQVFYFTAINTGSCSDNIIAYTIICHMEPFTYRPNGFSDRMYPFMYDSQNGVQYDEVVREQQLAPAPAPAGLISTLVSTIPTITSALPSLPIPTLPGIPSVLKVEGPVREMHELMQPASAEDSQRKRMSHFTLNFLDDTGWYITDKSQAQELEWGRGAGCSFVLDGCSSYASSHKHQTYYCSAVQAGKDVCTYDSRGIGTCSAIPGSNAVANGAGDACLRNVHSPVVEL